MSLAPGLGVGKAERKAAFKRWQRLVATLLPYLEDGVAMQLPGWSPASASLAPHAQPTGSLVLEPPPGQGALAPAYFPLSPLPPSLSQCHPAAPVHLAL